MPLIFDRPLDILKMQRPTDHHTHYGHRNRRATRCGHSMHPTAPCRTPLCPACITHRVNGTLDAALGALIAAGGAAPDEEMRNQQWRRAKLRYEIAKQRQSTNRKRNQLREEREEVWDDIHKQYDLQHLETAVAFQDFYQCPACASMPVYPTRFVRIQPERQITWWDHSVLNITVRPHRMPRKTQKTRGSSSLSRLIQGFREEMAITNAPATLAEAAVRRKNNINIDHYIAPDVWETPFCDATCRRDYNHRIVWERDIARQARGGGVRPIPPPSSLSYTELSADIEVDPDELEQVLKVEQSEALERKAWRVGEQVGYLYFVGDGFDGMYDWREDYMRSDRQLIYRESTRDADMSDSDTISEEADSSDKEQEKEEEQDTDSDEDMELDE